jgi:uncharacterized membrane protein
MLIPQFSLRWVLGVTAVCALLSLVAAQAVQGKTWAIATTAGMVSLGLIMLVHGSVFFVVWLFSLFRPGFPMTKTAQQVAAQGHRDAPDTV